MEKDKINNQLIFMKKRVKKAKVHVINKLTKQVKLLLKCKSEEKLPTKSKRKADRFLEEISILKKTKPDYVSKLVLSKAQDWKSILRQKNSSLEDRCLAMLATFGAVQKEIENFYNSNVDLIPKIPELIKEFTQGKKLSKGSTALNVKNVKQQNNNKRNLPLCKSDSNMNASKIHISNSPNCDIKVDFSSKGEEHSHQEDEKEIESKQDVEIGVNLGEVQNKNFASKNELSKIKKTILNTDILVLNKVMNEESSSDSDDNDLDHVSSDDALDNIIQTKVLKSKNFDNQKAEESSADSDNEAKTINSDDEISQQVSMKSLSNIKSSQSQKDPVQYHNNSKKNNLKDITVLDSDDLQELEEISVNKLLKSEEETYESDTVRNRVMIGESSSDSDDNSLEHESSDTMENIPQTKVLKSKNFDIQKAKESSAGSDSETKTINSDDESSEQVSMKSLSNIKRSQTAKCPVQYYNNSTKNSVKAITVLNLDDFQELEEIPVNKLLKNEEEACESDSEQVAPSLEEEIDTFFLRGTKADSVQTREIDFSKIHPGNLPFMSIDKKYHKRDIKWSSDLKPSVKRDFQKSSNNFNSFKSNDDISFKRDFKKSSNNFNSFKSNDNISFKRGFQKSPNNFNFFKSNDDISFKKGTSSSKEYKHRYEPEGKRFKKDVFYPKNSKKFENEPEGEKSSQLYKRGSYDKYSNELKDEKGTNFSHQGTVKKTDNVKPLHPSWEAKKKQKELIKTQFQGKRTVFDD